MVTVERLQKALFNTTGKIKRKKGNIPLRTLQTAERALRPFNRHTVQHVTSVTRPACDFGIASPYVWFKLYDIQALRTG